MPDITVGAGRTRPSGITHTIHRDVTTAASDLQALPADAERWWSVHSWQHGQRSSASWVSACGVAVDIDYVDTGGEHVEPPEASRKAIRSAMLDGNLFHDTPRGARVVVLWSETETDRDRQVQASVAVGELIAEQLRCAGITGYQVDTAVLKDLARFVWAPCAIVDGMRRDASVVVMRTDTYSTTDLVTRGKKSTTTTTTTPKKSKMKEASKKLSSSRSENWDVIAGKSKTCPMCGHKNCFGAVPSDPSRWVCYSANHLADSGGIGLEHDSATTGDVIDYRAWQQNRRPVDIVDDVTTKIVDEDITTTKETSKSKKISLTGLVSIFGDSNQCKKILGDDIHYDEMMLCGCVGRRRLDDSDYTTARCALEGMGHLAAKADVIDAIDLVVSKRRVHPVRDYLKSLRWDGVPRIDLVVSRILGCESSDDIFRIMMRRWFVSAVARPLLPGCKADCALILVGPQGIGKSTFFSALAGEYHADSIIDVSSKDMSMLLASSWIYEWSELDVMRTAKDHSTYKAVLSSRSDTYRPPYGRNSVCIPRHTVIVGTTNDVECLSDPTGSRRMWLIPLTSMIDIPLLTTWRDQLWAEAVELYMSGETWWLLPDEDAVRDEASQDNLRRDPWEDVISSWMVGQYEVRTRDILVQCLDKSISTWTRADEMRVASICRRLGWERRHVRTGSVWCRPHHPSSIQ